MSPNEFQRLVEPIVKRLSQEKEIVEIYTFGSANKNKIDVFSDIDITLVSADPARTSKNLRDIINKIQPTRYLFVLFEDYQEAAYSFFFQGLTVFQKIDLGITPSDAPIVFENSKLKFKSRQKSLHKPTLIRSKQNNQLEHDFIDTFIGASRFIKYASRDNPWLAFKFFNSFRALYLKQTLNVPKTTIIDLSFMKQLEEGSEDLTEFIFLADQERMKTVYGKYLKSYAKPYSSIVSKPALKIASEVHSLFDSSL